MGIIFLDLSFIGRFHFSLILSAIMGQEIGQVIPPHEGGRFYIEDASVWVPQKHILRQKFKLVIWESNKGCIVPPATITGD